MKRKKRKDEVENSIFPKYPGPKMHPSSSLVLCSQSWEGGVSVRGRCRGQLFNLIWENREFVDWFYCQAESRKAKAADELASRLCGLRILQERGQRTIAMTIMSCL